ncbi:MAG: four helix bundle protein [Acidobacteria bacterium]|nr:four helix bundle protein [Acidobacteriota bacterium]
MAKVWDIRERSFQFACAAVQLGQRLAKKGPICWTIASQLVKAGTSVGANLEEAKGASSRRDFLAKSNIALKESREALYWLRIIAACNLESASELQFLLNEANEHVAILTTIVKNTKSKSLSAS